jgi:hypothetical protein
VNNDRAAEDRLSAEEWAEWNDHRSAAGRKDDLSAAEEIGNVLTAERTPHKMMETAINAESKC